jgi:uncharacterized protein
MSNEKGVALITGASTGIGALYAERLARQGYDLILVARNGAKLAEVADRVRRETARSVETLTADLTVDADVRRVEEVLRSDVRITLLVNNAGVGATQPLLQSDPAAIDALLSLNVNALTRLTYAAAPAFVSRGAGTIVNIASVVAIAPELLNGAYGGSKAYVLAFSQSLKHELEGTGVRVQVVLPGATATAFWDIAGTPVDNLPAEIVMSAEDLVDAALLGLERGEFATIPALADEAQWTTFEAARQAMAGNLSTSTPAARYRVH